MCPSSLIKDKSLIKDAFEGMNAKKGRPFTFIKNGDRHRVQQCLRPLDTYGFALTPTITERTSRSKSRGMIFSRVFFRFTTRENHVEYIP